MPKIFVTRRPPESAVALLHDAFGAESVTIFPEDRPIGREELLAGVQGADGILSMLTEAMNGEVFDASGPHRQVCGAPCRQSSRRKCAAGLPAWARGVPRWWVCSR
jgi:hypothetical protein